MKLLFFSTKITRVNPIGHNKGKKFFERRFNAALAPMTVTRGSNESMSNPGFAPIWTPHEIPFEGNIFNGYAVPSGFFNQEYQSGSRIYHHEGVDFRGNAHEGTIKGTKIISFIYGKVINTGWIDNTLGRVLVVANIKDEGIYLLAHLSGYANDIQRGSIIEPYDEVAYVGGSGEGKENRWNSHLHLEYYHVRYTESNDVDESARNQYVRVVSNNVSLNPSKILQLHGVLMNKENRKNPFNHGE